MQEEDQKLRKAGGERTWIDMIQILESLKEKRLNCQEREPALWVKSKIHSTWIMMGKWTVRMPNPVRSD